MAAVRKLREVINESAGRWESAAVSLEVCMGSSRQAIAQRVDALRLEATRAAERLGGMLAEAHELSLEARQRTVRDVDQLKEHIRLSRIENRAAALAWRQDIEGVRQRLEERLERIADDVHPEFEHRVSDWVRAQMELDTGLELLAQWFLYEQVEDRALFEARRREMLKRIENFRNMLQEKRYAATRRGRPFGSEMNAAYNRIRNSFAHLAC